MDQVSYGFDALAEASRMEGVVVCSLLQPRSFVSEVLDDVLVAVPCRKHYWCPTCISLVIDINKPLDGWVDEFSIFEATFIPLVPLLTDVFVELDDLLDLIDIALLASINEQLLLLLLGSVHISALGEAEYRHF